ncbi:MAG: hypothetical protein QNJ12_21575 [Ilumatobacter sp.]|uniref:hypothetical protein n=1 Tax=Ilumatobacter sp. TaxID=1967498 RepID=UPI0026041465|nr:hypothetical protein [Ilumatobacter sp.]MDJ0771391.1 hypothetical protein [Ilumatobacter sp.]
MGSRAALAAAVVAMLAAGCNGDGDAATTTTEERPTSTATSEPEVTSPPTSAPPSSDTTSPSTSAPEPTTSTSDATTPSTAPTTSSEPSTSLDPDDVVANTLAIIETVERSFEIYNAALNDPFDDDKVAALETVFTARLVEGWTNIIEDYRANDFRSLPNPDMPARYDVDVNSVEVNLSNGTGGVQVCHLNTFVKVEVGGNPDGTDRIVDDDVTERVEQLELVREGTTWKVNRASLPDDDEVVTPCG